MTFNFIIFFLSRDAAIWSALFRSYVRPHLEFAVAAWNPSMKKDIAILEKVQRRVTRIPHCNRGLSYEERLTKMNLMKLELRRTRGDLIQMFKVRNNSDTINWCSPLNWSAPRANKRAQLRREIVTACRQRHHFFTNRVTNAWNNLPDEVVESGTVDDFKKKLDLHLKRRPL